MLRKENYIELSFVFICHKKKCGQPSRNTPEFLPKVVCLLKGLIKKLLP